MATDTTGWNGESSASTKIALDGDVGVYYVEYYLKKLTDPDDDTADPVMEFHGDCFVDGVDVTSWVANEEISCDLGFYYPLEEGSADPLLVDWMQIKMVYSGT